MRRKLFGSLGAAVLSVIALALLAVLVSPSAQAANRWSPGSWTPRPTSTAPSSTPAPTTSPAPAPSGGLTALEQDAWNRINTERTKAGCAALVLDPKIQAVARAFAADMRDKNYFSHTSSDGKNAGQRLTAGGVSWRGWAENIAKGYSSGQAVVAGWMSSPGHAANIKNCSYRTSGLAAATGGAGGPVWVEDFVTP
jgi:uncharacterized protein YkwD